MRRCRKIGIKTAIATGRGHPEVVAPTELFDAIVANNGAKIFCGDDLNGIDILQYAGVGIAMDNAIYEAKTAADFICGDCDDDGVAKWLEENVL